MSRVLDRAFDQPMKLEEHSAMSLAGGIMQHGYQCGMIWGAALSAGAEAWRRFGPGPQAEAAAIMAAQKLVESFRAQNNHIDCVEIIDIDKSSSSWKMITYFLIKGGAIGCIRRAARYAPTAFAEINDAFSEEIIDLPDPPVSCAAMVAEKMGASEMHTVIAAGFAGGIGLCGGACGALGAAIWLVTMDSLKDQEGKADFKNPRATAAIEAFVRCTDCRFQCANIVGRKFQSVADHAAHLRDGGCAEIIEVLANA